jgi:murein DD-endopeptidase MepM/ murein hydrolase activator NlpD
MSKNRYAYPVKLGKHVRVSYIESPAHVGRLIHAVDFIVAENTEVYAALEGKVVDVKQDSDKGGRARYFDRYGNYIEIRHANDEYSIYEHIRKDGAVVKVGDIVKKGQLIGYSGKTGWIAHLGPHLHFDVHKYFGKGPNDYETIEIN